MTERMKSYIAVYLATLACVLAIASMQEDNFKSTASRADLRVAVMEVKNQTMGIAGMRKLRNDQRARGERMERAVLLLTIAFAVASPALIASAAGAWFLLYVSGIAVGSAVWFIWTAMV
jgi:hypothetical protein